MGFWHTGYIEFHEATGIDPPVIPKPKRFFCDRCDKSFASREKLDNHRFEGHPQRRPVMVLRGHELGANRTKITRSLIPSDIRIDCDSAWLNGAAVAVPDLPGAIAASSAATVCRIKLRKGDVIVDFELEFRIASEQDLAHVERRFLETLRGKRLDSEVVNDFIGDKREFRTAIGYCDGISSYLYGMLAREQKASSSPTTLSYKDYEKKLNNAADTLQDYDRPLARAIVGLVEFHFNHFTESANIAPGFRVGTVSERYRRWISTERQVPPRDPDTNVASNQEVIKAAPPIDRLLTDQATERIIGWSVLSAEQLSPNTGGIESFLSSTLPKYDSAKLRVLLGEIHAASNNANDAVTHAKFLLHTPPFQPWAERLIASVRK